MAITMISTRFLFAKHLSNEIATDAVADVWQFCKRYNKNPDTDTNFVRSVLKTSIIRNISKHLGDNRTYYKYFVKRFLRSHPNATDEEVSQIYNLSIGKVKRCRMELDDEQKYKNDVKDRYLPKYSLENLTNEESSLIAAVDNGYTISTVTKRLGWSKQKVKLVAESAINKYGS